MNKLMTLAAVCMLAASLPAYAADPTSTEMIEAMATARRKEWVLLAAMAGRANAADSGAGDLGRRIEEQARMGYDSTAQPRGQGAHGADRSVEPSATAPLAAIVHRIKAHLAA